ncbi:type 1 periplasmic binding fold superfamily protein [Flavobacteriaceae bacterium]|nr:type 1 periplasmic binding fold superfamily protein [Flavobacteriaceae bacterium]
MKTIKFLSTAIFASALIFSCSSDDDSTPEPVLEEEVITTMTITLTADGQADVILQTQDLDGDGPDLPVVTVSGDLSENTMYSGSIVLLNETEDPAENITEEIEEEALEHQFFYTIGNGLNAETDYNDADSDGNPIGLDFVLSTNSVSSGSITFTLRHEPTKPNMGIEVAGGETDIEATFDIAIQ